MEQLIINKYYVAESGKTKNGNKPMYVNIVYGNKLNIESASKWEDQESLMNDMKNFMPDKSYKIRYVEEVITRLID